MVKTKYNSNKKKKEKIGKYNKAYTSGSLGSTFKPDLINKLSAYCSLIGVDRTKYISEVLEKELKGLILTNDFITLEKPFYFNWQELEEKEIVEATSEKPIQHLEKYVVVKKVSNNLDLFNTEINSYCFEDSFNTHRGLFIYPKPVFEESTLNFKDVIAHILYFNYNSKYNKLTISLIDYNELDLYLDLKTQLSVKEKLFNDLAYYVENIIDNEGDLNIELWASTFEVLENYQSIKAIEDSIATNSGFVKVVKEVNPSAKVTSSTSEDLIKYMQVVIKKERHKRLNNLELQKEIKARSLEELLFNTKKKGYPKNLVEVDLKDLKTEDKFKD